METLTNDRRLSMLSREELEAEVTRLRSLVEADVCKRQRSFARLAKNARNFWVSRKVQRRPASEVTPLQFARDYVAASQPLVLTGLCDTEWPCLRRWQDNAYLLNAVGDVEVSVNVTPDGFGDSVDDQGRFVKPCEERMHFGDFWSWLHDTKQGANRPGVPYLSRQNDSLREEMWALTKDIPEVSRLGLEAFGNHPEAVNLWIGDERAVSSCHKDHYENLYIVVRGEKIFTLLPPVAVPFLHETRCTPATYARRGGMPDGPLEALPDTPPESESLHEAWETLGGGQPVPWIPFDVSEEQDPARFPAFVNHGQRLAVEVRVKPGEMLYLPAMWYHRVAQQGVTVAVNYWHDMHFGHGYVHHMFLRDIAGLDPDEEEEDSSDGDRSGP